jgi:tRNA (guanine-N7-)-methyltransferase
VAAFSSPPTKRESSTTHPINKNINDINDNNYNSNIDNDSITPFSESKSKLNHRSTTSTTTATTTPWNHPNLSEEGGSSSCNPKDSKTSFRSRQHVNPLASKFQQPTILSKDWPRDVYSDLSRPLFLDIGCSRGGFLLDLASQRPNDYNYLGLEIRPTIVHHAQDRLGKRPHLHGHLDFVGCNANVDLERLLTRLAEETVSSKSNNNKSNDNDINKNDNKNKSTCPVPYQLLQIVCIQFPDPHFKSRHAKRRVVTPELVQTLARFMPMGAMVFLQSDVQPVLDEMRRQFRGGDNHQPQSQYFEDKLVSVEEYIAENIFGIPTEREVSVMNQHLPVYRSIFTRTNTKVS